LGGISQGDSDRNSLLAKFAKIKLRQDAPILIRKPLGRSSRTPAGLDAGNYATVKATQVKTMHCLL
jgi:hypothetical protein